jgi:hypothetical protein
MKTIAFILKMLFSGMFILLFVRSIQQFDVLYLKFSLIEFIQKHRLAKLFYVIAGMQLFLGAAIFFIHIKPVRYCLEGILILYLSFTVSYLVYVNYLYEGCIQCGFAFQYFNERFMTTIVISLFLFLVYLALLLSSKRIRGNQQE